MLGQADLNLLQAKLAVDLDSYIGHLPPELRRYWKSISVKTGKSARSDTKTALPLPSVSASATSSAMPSRTQSPMISRHLEGSSSTVSSSLQDIEMAAESTMASVNAPAAAVDQREASTPAMSATGVAKSEIKKLKKRKRAVPKDDIDAIFAGL